MPVKVFNYRPLIRSAARRIWMWSPMRKEAIRNARVGNGCVGCNVCSRRMKENAKVKEYRVDHIIPATEPSAHILSWDDFFARLFVPASEHQILCLKCHDKKTELEDSKRVNRRPKAKKKRTIRQHR